MDLLSLVHALLAAGCKAEVQGDRLTFIPPPPKELREAVKAQKAALLEAARSALAADEWEWFHGEWGPEKRRKRGGGRGAFAVC